jgi:hypothetical protein
MTNDKGLLPKTHSAHWKEFLTGDLSFRKLAIVAQTRDLLPFRFTKNGYQKFFNVRSRDMGNSPKCAGAKGRWCSPAKGEKRKIMKGRVNVH